MAINTKYDKSKCKQEAFKGSTGCGCSYCRAFSSQKSKWIVVKHGDKNEFEISIVRETNRHGRVSWGWFDENKILISSTHHGVRIPSSIYNMLLKLAQTAANKFNIREGHI